MSIETCSYCNRIGLPFLPLRMAYVPNGLKNLPAGLLSANSGAKQKITTGTYMLRVITEGYVYVLDTKSGLFRCFAATTTGHFKECELNQAPTTQPSFQCAQKGHNEVASLISIPQATNVGEVWVGYSRVWWTKNTRALIKKDAALRGQLMVSMNAAAVVKQGALPPATGIRLADAANLVTIAPEYAKTPTDFQKIDQIFAEGTTRAAVNRTAIAGALVDKMKAISPGNAIVLALPDIIGVTQDINHWRNLKAGDLGKYIGDASRMRNRVVGDLILGIKASMTKQGQMKEWNNRYASKINMGKVEADKNAHIQAVKKLDQKAQLASEDWCSWSNSDLFKQAWKVYDGMDSTDGKLCGAALERDFCRCVFGSGATKKEQAWWKEWLTASPADQNHPLWLALAAGDKSVMDFLAGDAAKPFDVGKSDKGVDLVKNGKELKEKIHDWHIARKNKGLLRVSQEESGLLAMTMASQLKSLSTSAGNSAALVAGQRLRIMIVSRMDVQFTPTYQKITLQQLVVQLHEVSWGGAQASATTVVKSANTLNVTQNLRGAWLGGRYTSITSVITDVWIPDAAVKAGTSPVLQIKGTQPTLALPAPALNPWRGVNEYTKGLGAAGKGLLLLGAALQISNLSSSLIQLDQALKGNAASRDGDIKESMYGVVSGALGVMALTGEVVAGVARARVTQAVVSTAATRILTASGVIALGGGVLGVISAMVEATQAGLKNYDLRNAGDIDAADSYVVVAFSAFGVAVAGGALSIIGAGATFAAAGSTGVIATAVTSSAFTLGLGTTAAGAATMATIPVIGWIVLLVAAIGIGIYFSWQAAMAEDTPLEKWLSRCFYRDDAKYAKTNRKKFTDLKEELAEFQQAIYGLVITLNWQDNIIGKDRIELSVIMPGYNQKTSDFAFLLELKGNKFKQLIVDRRTSSLSTDPDLKPQPHVQPQLSAVPNNSQSVPMDELLEIEERIELNATQGSASLAGKVKVNDSYFKHAKLKFEYWPDAMNNPSLKMTIASGGGNTLEKQD